MQQRLVTAAVGTLLLLFSACGLYSTSGRTAGNIKKIAVPYLTNETAEPQIEIDITQNIIDGLVKDNTLKVVPEGEADAILEGKIIAYSNIPFTYNTELQADQYRLVIGLVVSLFNPKENTYIWTDKRIDAYSDYYLETVTERTYAKALEEVYKEIVDAILSNTVQEW
jgi:hypothetical protein